MMTDAARRRRTSDVVRRDLTRQRRDARAVAGRVGRLGFQLALLLSLVTAFAILVTLLAGVVRGGLGVLVERPWDFLTSGTSADPERAGVWQGIKGSLYIAAVVVVVAFPLGIGTAVYLEEYAPDNRVSRFIALNVRNLAGVPSIVYGLLGLAIFVKLLGDLTGPDSNGQSALSAGLTLAVLVLPIVIISAAEAIRAVPTDVREASYGLGSTQWEVIRNQVLPYAAPGILTGTILALLRALGEAAPLIVIGAVTGFFATGATDPLEELRSRFTALPMQIFTWARQPRGEFRDELASAAIIVMLVVLVTANLGAVLLRNRYERRRQG